MVSPGWDVPADLEDVRTRTTLRDTLHELPIDAIVPDGWRVGTTVVSFRDELPADGVTVSHPASARELLLTDAGTEGETLGVYERDRRTGRRVRVASVAGREDDPGAVRAGLEETAERAARIEPDV
ncbi:hypothetical protein [Halorarum halobium]|uniref:hypothetical protein n=1 Tax=Halorarum halobium TaxID=3075121 RepID=UPI0028AAD975|nr:hypothetical protein [Halobaculum sp. XH14]